MAYEHLLAPWCPRYEIVRPDHGDWISGPGASDEVRPFDLEPGDRIVRDGAAVTVERTRPGERDWNIWWQACTARGVFDVDRGERITRFASSAGRWQRLGCR